MTRPSKFQAIRGAQDLLPEEALLWGRIEGAAREVFGAFGFSELRTPILEPTALFARSIGESTDIVEKEMYTFADTGGDSVTLRPEGTAGAVRAYIEHSLGQEMRVARLFYLGPMFRRERPQKGRLRQFHQIGAEVLGSPLPAVEVTILALLQAFFEKLGIEGTRLEVNTLGGPGTRALYREKLREYFLPRIAGFCDDCRRRIETNPLRILDCKLDAEKTNEAPRIIDQLSAEDGAHWQAVLRGLEDAGLAFAINPRIVRGLDYYTRTVFEFTASDLGAQNAVAAGGRYDGLVEQLGGPPTPAAGFAVGIERLALLLAPAQGAASPAPAGPLLFVGSLGEAGAKAALRTALDLSRRGIRAEVDLLGGSLQKQMKYAGRLGARYLVVLGDEELASKQVHLKRLSDGATETLALAALAERLGALSSP